MLIDGQYYATALTPVADALSGTATTAEFDLSKFGKLFFVIQKGAGGTGTSTITLIGSDDASPPNSGAVPFKYREVLTGDLQGEIKQATATGFTLTAGANQVYVIEADPAEFGKDGYRTVHLQAVEVVDGAVLAGILAIGMPVHAAITETAIEA